MRETHHKILYADQFVGGGINGVSPFARSFYVGGVGASLNNNGKSYNKSFPATADGMAAAIAACTANRGDTIFVAPNNTITLTAALALSKAGIRIIGLGDGLLKPQITVNFAGDGLNFSAANVYLDNFHFTAPETDNATAMINVAAAGCAIRNITGIGSKTAKNFVDCITLASGADDFYLENVKFNNSVVAVNSFLSMEAAVARFTLRNFRAFGDVVEGGIIDAATATQIDWRDINVSVVGTDKPAATLNSNPTGTIERARFSGTSTTLATNAALGTGVRLFDVLVLEETDGSKQGALIPAVDTD
jgi:hypothetical protein